MPVKIQSPLTDHPDMPMPHKAFPLPTKERLNELYEYSNGALKRRDNGRTYDKKSSDGYVVCYVYIESIRKSRAVGVHRVIYQMHHGDLLETDLIDHIDGNQENNRIENLRKATQAQNTRNTRAHRDGATGYKGVSFYKNGLFRAQIYVNGKTIFLGTTKTPEEAHELYKRAALKFFGEFSRAA